MNLTTILGEFADLRNGVTADGYAPMPDEPGADTYAVADAITYAYGSSRDWMGTPWLGDALDLTDLHADVARLVAEVVAEVDPSDLPELRTMAVGRSWRVTAPALDRVIKDRMGVLV